MDSGIIKDMEIVEREACYLIDTIEQQEMEIVEREACYLIDTIEQSLERIVNYNDLTDEEMKSIKDMAIIMLQEWS